MPDRHLAASADPPSSREAGLAVLRVLIVNALLALLFPLGGAIYVLPGQDFGDGWRPFVAFLIPVGLALGGWLTLLGHRWSVDRKALLRLGLDRRPGEWVAVTGIARAVGEPFEEPVVGGPALACHYQVHESSSSQSSSGSSRPSRVLRFEGFHLTPTFIETEEGPVHLAGFPDLDSIPRTKPSSGTPFDLGESIQPIKGEPWRTLLALFGPMLTRSRRDAGGSTRERSVSENALERLTDDHAHAGATAGRARPRVGIEPRFLWRARSLAGPMTEAAIDRMYGIVEQDPWRSSRVLRPDTEVCVLGRWADGQILPSLHRPAGLPVYAGGIDKTLRELRRDARAFLTVGRVVLGVSLALLAYVVFS